MGADNEIQSFIIQSFLVDRSQWHRCMLLLNTDLFVLTDSTGLGDFHDDLQADLHHYKAKSTGTPEHPIPNPWALIAGF